MSDVVPNGVRDEVRDRLMKLEWKQEEQDKRLSQGAGAFSDLRQSITEVKQDIHKTHLKMEEANAKFQEMLAPKPIPIWKIVSTATGVFVFIGGLIWAFARYPDRTEFEKAQEKHEHKQEKLEGDLNHLRSEQVEIKTDQRLIKESMTRQERAQQAIDSKLDKILETPRRR